MPGHKGVAVEVPFDPAEVWGSQIVRLWRGRKGYLVAGTIDGTRFESAVVRRMRRFFVLIDAAVAREAGARTGATSTLSLLPREPNE